MPFYAYILRSLKTRQLYKGHSEDLEDRLGQHNYGKTKSNKSGIPWCLTYYETFDTREYAVTREKYFKTAAGSRFIKKLDLSKLLEVPRPPE